MRVSAHILKQNFLTGCCSECGKACYVECGKCFAVLDKQGQSHNCQDSSDKGFNELELCYECQSELNI